MASRRIYYNERWVEVGGGGESNGFDFSNKFIGLIDASSTAAFPLASKLLYLPFEDVGSDEVFSERLISNGFRFGNLPYEKGTILGDGDLLISVDAIPSRPIPRIHQGMYAEGQFMFNPVLNNQTPILFVERTAEGVLTVIGRGSNTSSINIWRTDYAFGNISQQGSLGLGSAMRAEGSNVKIASRIDEFSFLLFMASGPPQVIFSNDNGLTWNRWATPTNTELVVKFKGAWYAFQGTNVYRAASAGSSWSPVGTLSAPTGFNLRGYGREDFMVLHRGATLQISEDGVNWNLLPSPPWPPTWYQPLIFSGDVFFIWGSSVSAGQGNSVFQYYYSLDRGDSWHTVDISRIFGATLPNPTYFQVAGIPI